MKRFWRTSVISAEAESRLYEYAEAPGLAPASTCGVTVSTTTASISSLALASF
jgi:hypothetical protein